MANEFSTAGVQRNFILQSVEQLRQCPWYWGALSSQDAEAILADQPVGSYLVRDSQDMRHFFSLSYKGERRVYHSRIGQDKGQFFLGRTHDPRGCALSLIDLFRVARELSQRGECEFLLYPTAGRFDAEYVSFVNPIYRKKGVASLQLLCKRTLIRQFAWDDLDLLPIPVQLKSFLKSTSICPYL